MRFIFMGMVLLYLVPDCLRAQPNPTTAGLAGGGAAALLGSGLNSGAGSTSPAGGTSAPIEINIMIYRGLAEIAKTIAEKAKQTACHGPCADDSVILVEDSTSANQVALYQALMAYKSQLDQLHTTLSLAFAAPAPAPAPAAPAAPPAPGAGAGAAAATTPPWITNFGAIGTAIEGLKSSMSYSSSSVQPTVQAFETLVENELRIRKFVPYTSTSTLNLDDAVNQLTSSLLTMSAQSSDVTGWAAGCKPPAGGDPNLCAAQSSSLAAAQQVINGYTALLQSSNDGAGNAVILDILRGAVLVNTAGGHHLPSIQLTIPAAGGSTRVNAFFLVNLFYLPKPSYNAGVIALFEIRDGNNLLEYSGARTVFYDYNKTWLGAKFTPDTIKAGCSASDDDTTCIMTRD